MEKTWLLEVYFFLVRYEDHGALDGGEEGLDQAATILAMARHILKRNRWEDSPIISLVPRPFLLRPGNEATQSNIYYVGFHTTDVHCSARMCVILTLPQRLYIAGSLWSAILTRSRVTVNT